MIRRITAQGIGPVFDPDNDNQQNPCFGVRATVELEDGRVYGCPVVWSANDLNNTPQQISNLMCALLENWINSISDAAMEAEHRGDYAEVQL